MHLITNTGLIVKFGAAVILLASALSVPALAQTTPTDTSSIDDAIPPNVTQSSGPPADATQLSSKPPQSSGGWYDPAKSKRFSAMNAKNAGRLSPDFGDGLLGDAGGVRSDLADVGIAGVITLSSTWRQNVLNAPRQSDGRQIYIGQRDTHSQQYGLYATYDLGHIGLEGA